MNSKRIYCFSLVTVLVLSLLPMLAVTAQPSKVQEPNNTMGTEWLPGTEDPFDLRRYDCVWFDDGSGRSAYNQKVYCPGGRSGTTAESPDIWRYDPMADAWEDTGHDLPESVSNYSANVLEDENGWAIYVVGGYDRDSSSYYTQIQRYYPATGQADVVTTDPWPVTVGGSNTFPGGCATVDNKIYCFGAWESVAAPYFSEQTWEYDPARSAGSRWLRIATADMSQARAYIQVAVQESVIYAMGGHSQYSPSTAANTPDSDDLAAASLVPSAVVEALDVNDLAAGWQVLAPMPVATAQGRGFGLQANTVPPLQPSWVGKIYVAGGVAVWPTQTSEVMEYDVDSNTWNQAFPDLIAARRDHAGAFVPLCTQDPTDGMPGMWVFGGRIIEDSPPYGSPEYFSLDCALYFFYLPLIINSQ